MKEDLISEAQLIRKVNVQSETVKRYIRQGKLVPDVTINSDNGQPIHYFKEDTLLSCVWKFGWTLLEDYNPKDIFISMVCRMTMSYSYKPLLLKAILENADSYGRVSIIAVVDYFRNFYESRRALGLPVEKQNSLFSRTDYTDSEAKRNILSNPFKRYHDMQILHYKKELGVIYFDPSIWNQLTEYDKQTCLDICDTKLDEYYHSRFPD